MASGLNEELQQEELWHRLVIEAFAKHAAWPSLLAHVMKKSGQARNGLLFCAVDARGDTVQLQIPVATQPPIAPPLCHGAPVRQQQALRKIAEGSFAGARRLGLPILSWHPLEDRGRTPTAHESEQGKPEG